MKTRFLSLLLFIIAAAIALFILHTFSGEAVYFISIGGFIVTNSLFYLITSEQTLRKALFVICIILSIHIAGQFDADPIRLISSAGIIIIAICSIYRSRINFGHNK